MFETINLGKFYIRLEEDGRLTIIATENANIIRTYSNSSNSITIESVKIREIKEQS